jgi:hypothetical protein
LSIFDDGCHYYALKRHATKQTKIGDRQCRYNLKVRALTIANSCIGHGAPLHRDCIFAIMGGGGNFHGVEKLEAVCCLSFLFLVTQDTVRLSKKENVSR